MVLIIDNFDSFTYNLYHYFLELGAPTLVRNRDELTLDDVEALKPEFIVLSPGPGNPAQAELPLAVIDRFKGSVPILGVCLGHQCIAHYFGAKVVEGERPVHGKTALMHHDGRGIYDGLASPFWITRYHSLVVDKQSLPSELGLTAWTEDGTVMGIRHRDYPIEGVQFHPEAVLTQHGHDMLRNFLRRHKHEIEKA